MDVYAGPTGLLHLRNGATVKLGRRSPQNPVGIAAFEADIVPIAGKSPKKVSGASSLYDCFGMVVAHRRGVPYSFNDDAEADYQRGALKENWDDFVHYLEMDGYRRKASLPAPGNLAGC